MSGQTFQNLIYEILNRMIRIAVATGVLLGLAVQSGISAGTASTGNVFLPIVLNNDPDTIIQSGSIGSITYTLDTAKARSGLFPADKVNGLVLSVTDVLGYTWTLAVPKDGLLTPTTLTMTPFATVDSSNAQVTVKTGVNLQPDGLVFADPATLTLTFPSGSNEKGLMLDSQQSGINLAFADATNAANGYSATVYHFSTSDYTSDGNDLSSYLPAAEAAYTSALARVKSLANVVEQPGIPPDYTYNCQNLGLDTAEQAANDYEKTVFSRDNAAIQDLLGATRALELITGNTNNETVPFQAITHLMETDGFRKINAILNGYGGDPLKFLAISTTVISFSRDYQLLGGTQNVDSWLQVLVTDGQKVRQYYMDQLTKNHDYTMLSVLIEIERTLLLLGMPDDEPTFFTNLQNAYTFNLVLDNQSGSDVNLETTSQHGQISNHLDFSTQSWKGSGSMGYESGQIVMPQGVATLQTPLTYTVDFSFGNFDFCKNMSADLTLSPMGAPVETYLVSGQSVPLSGFAQADAIATLKSYMDQNQVAWTFHLSFTNKQIQIVDQTINGTGLGGTHTALYIQLQHAPK